MARLERHDWPGNVRELANVIEQIYVRSDGARIEADHVVDVLPPAAHENEPSPVLDLGGAVARLERSMIADALKQAAGNKREAARLLGLSRSSLYAKIKQYGAAGG